MALDLVDIPEAKRVAAEVAGPIDIMEIGTPVVINERLHAFFDARIVFEKRGIGCTMGRIRENPGGG